MSKHLLVVGGGLMQLPALRLAQKKGLVTVCLDANPQALGRGESQFFYQADIKDENQCLQVAQEHKRNYRLDGVLTVGTDFSTTVAFIANALGLPGIPYENARNAKDKALMRQIFHEKKVPSPQFTVFTSKPAGPLKLNFNYPAVVKPADNMGARGVCRVENESECQKALTEAFTFSPTGKVVVEEYIEGPEFSLDAIVRDGKVIPMGFADRTIIFPPSFVEIGHTFPSAASETVRQEVWSVFEQGVRALGLTWGAAKGDMKYSPGRGAVIGEIAARLSGGFMSGWTYPYSSGRSAILWAIENALGENLSPQSEELNQPVVERAWISIPGTIKKLLFLDQIEELPGVQDVFLNWTDGKPVVLPKNNVQKGGSVICTGPTVQMAMDLARLARNGVVAQLHCPDPATEAFFWKDTQSPWWFDEARTWQNDLDLPALRLQGRDKFFDDRNYLSECENRGWTDVYGNSPTELWQLFQNRVLPSVGLETGEFPPVFWYFFYKGGVQGALYFLHQLNSQSRSHG